MIKISVIVRTYNSGKFVKKAIDSALNQTLDKKKYEIVVVDDGSKDNTLGILKDFKEKVRLVKQKHLGARAASRNGIKKSRGRYIMFLDSDDEILPETLKKMLKAFNDASVDYAYCDYFEKIGKYTKKVSLAKNIFNSLWTTIMIKKDLFKEIGFPDPKMFFGEYDFLIKLMRAKKIGKHIEEPLYIYNRGEGTMTSDKNMVERGINQIREKYVNIAEKIRKY